MPHPSRQAEGNVVSVGDLSNCAWENAEAPLILEISPWQTNFLVKVSVRLQVFNFSMKQSKKNIGFRRCGGIF